MSLCSRNGRSVDQQQISLKFINRYRDTWPAGVSALEGGLVNVEPLISHVFPLEGALEAMALCSDISRGSIKVQIVDEEFDHTLIDSIQ